MAISKERKMELVQHYVELIEKSEGMVLIENRGLSMKSLGPLRTKLREAGGELHVVKNTLACQALKQLGRPAPDALFTQTTAIGFALKDVPGVAKVLIAAAKESPLVVVKGGLLGSQVLSAKDVEALSELPPLPVMRAQLLGLIAAPATRLTGVIAGGVRQVMNVLKAYADKAEPASETPAAA